MFSADLWLFLVSVAFVFVSALVLAQHVPASALIGRHSRGFCKCSDWLTLYLRAGSSLRSDWSAFARFLQALCLADFRARFWRLSDWPTFTRQFLFAR